MTVREALYWYSVDLLLFIGILACALALALELLGLRTLTVGEAAKLLGLAGRIP
jgi:hypothetical protein